MKILDNTQIIKRIDTEDMYHKIIHMPEQVSFAYSDAKIRKPQNFQFRDFSTIKRILICGMGGSAISADIAKVAFSNILPIDDIYGLNLMPVFHLVLQLHIYFSHWLEF